MFFTLFCSIASPRLYDCIVYYLFSGTFEGGEGGGWGGWHIYLSVEWFDNLIYKKWFEETPYCRCNRSVLIKYCNNSLPNIDQFIWSKIDQLPVYWHACSQLVNQSLKRKAIS